MSDLLLQILIALAPALLLVSALLAHRYPGEETIARLTQAMTQRRRPRAPARLAPKPRTPRVLVRSGELLARSLATRPPPLALTA